MSLALTEGERQRGERFKPREQDGRKPGVDPFDDGWTSFRGLSDYTRGLDGANYANVQHENGRQHYVQITSAGHFEFVRVDQDPTKWVADREIGAPQPLAPLSAIGGDCRSDREDLILSFAAQRPVELRELSWMPTDVFTTTRRFEIYDAMLTLRVRGKEITPEATLAILETRLEDALPRNPWIRRYELHDSASYLTRLLITPSDAISAMEAAEYLHAADHRARLAHQQNSRSTVVHPPALAAAQTASSPLNLESATQLLPLNTPTLLDVSSTPQVRP